MQSGVIDEFQFQLSQFFQDVFCRPSFLLLSCYVPRKSLPSLVGVSPAVGKHGDHLHLGITVEDSAHITIKWGFLLVLAVLTKVDGIVIVGRE